MATAFPEVQPGVRMWLIDLDAPGPYPSIPFVKFFNPALAFEELPRDTTVGYDWYRFTRSDTTRPLTIVIPSSGRGHSTLPLPRIRIGS